MTKTNEKVSLCSLLERINSVKMSLNMKVCPKPSKNLMQSYPDPIAIFYSNIKDNSKIYMESQKTPNRQSNWMMNNNGGITLLV